MNPRLNEYASYSRGLTHIGGAVSALEDTIVAGQCDMTDCNELAKMETELSALLTRVQALKATAG